MDFPSIINRIYIFVGSSVSLLAFTFLLIAIIYRHRCFNFPTLLTCNTILAVFIYSFVNTISAVYMLIWDQQPVPDIDSFCSLRAYIHHAAMAAIHHSLVLQALQKYLKIKRMNFLRSRDRQVSIVVIQWIIDLTFGLPVFLTGNMSKMSSENVCFVSITRLDLLFYMITISFLLSDITLIVLYRRLVSHVREISLRVQTNQQHQLRRDLIVVRRIILLNSQLALIGIIVTTFVILGLIRTDLLPAKWMRPLLLAVTAILCPMIIILFWMTPNLHRSLIECLQTISCLLNNE